MKTRHPFDFLKALALSALLLTSLGLPLYAQDAPSADEAPAPTTSQGLAPLPQIDYVVQNRDFYILNKPQRSTPGRVEVLVFFWYGSPWSARVDPYIRQWVASGQAPANVTVRYVPVVLTSDWGFSARIFFALEQMGVEQALTPKLLRAVAAKVVDLDSPQSVTTWLSEQGVPPAKFQSVINSDQVVARVSSLPVIARDYQVKSTPTFVIDGRYLIPSTEKMPPERATAIALFMAKHLSEGGKRP